MMYHQSEAYFLDKCCTIRWIAPFEEIQKKLYIKLLVEFGKETKIIFNGKWKSFSFNEKSDTTESIFQVLITIRRHNNNSSTVLDSSVKIALYLKAMKERFCTMYNAVRIIAKYIVDYIPIRQIISVSN